MVNGKWKDKEEMEKVKIVYVYPLSIYMDARTVKPT